MEIFTQKEGWWRGYQKQPLSLSPIPFPLGCRGQLSSWYKSAVLHWFTPAEHLASRHFRLCIKRTATWCTTYKSLSQAKAVALTCALLGHVAPCHLPWHQTDTAKATPWCCHLEKTSSGSHLPSPLTKWRWEEEEKSLPAPSPSSVGRIR